MFDPLDSFVDGSTLFSLKVVEEEVKRQKHFRSVYITHVM